jgi:predicted nucleic acid-binding protein
VTPMRVMLDSNAVNPLALDPEVDALMREAVSAGRLELVTASLVQRDEVDASKDDEVKRAALVRFIDEVTVPADTPVFVLGVSRLDVDRLGAVDEADATYKEVQIGSRRHSEDAVILVTAQREGIPVVTNETRRLRNQCLKRGIKVMTSDDLIASVRLL